MLHAGHPESLVGTGPPPPTCARAENDAVGGNRFSAHQAVLGPLAGRTFATGCAPLFHNYSIPIGRKRALSTGPAGRGKGSDVAHGASSWLGNCGWPPVWVASSNAV